MPEFTPVPNHQVTVLEALMTATAILADVNDTTAAAASLPASMSGQVLRGAMIATDAIAAGAASIPGDRRGPLAAALVQGALHHLLAALALECAAAGLTTRELADTLAGRPTHPAAPPAPEAGDRRITTALEG